VEYNDKYDEIKFKKYLSDISEYSPMEMYTKLITNFLSGSVDIENIDDYAKSNIQTIISDYVSTLETDKKDKIHTLMMELFQQVREN